MIKEWWGMYLVWRLLPERVPDNDLQSAPLNPSLVLLTCILYFSEQCWLRNLHSGVNTARSYVDIMNFGHWNDAAKSVTIDRPTLQGGIVGESQRYCCSRWYTQVAVYYLPGTLLGAFIGGSIGDRFGRINTIAVAAAWAIIGACLQCSAQNSTWMICGTGLYFARSLQEAKTYSSYLQRHWDRDPECHHSCLGDWDGRAYLPRPIRGHRIHAEHLWGGCCLLDWIVSTLMLLMMDWTDRDKWHILLRRYVIRDFVQPFPG